MTSDRLQTEDKSVIRAFGCGCISGAISTVCFQPLDVIKTRIQAETVQNIPSRGIFCTIKDILQPAHETNCVKSKWKNRSVNAHRLGIFWSGTVPALWRCVPGVGGYFACLSALDRICDHCRVPSSTNEQIGFAFRTFVLGFFARTIVAAALTPFSVAKTQAESGFYGDSSMWQTLKRVGAHAKWKGLYSGMWATLFRDSPYSGIYLTAYSTTKRFIGLEGKGGSLALLTFCASFASFVATSLTQPADVLRAHRQLLLHLQASSSVSHSTLKQSTISVSWQQVFIKILRTEGISGLWRGFSLRLLRRMGVACVSWVLFERVA